jgi:8-oxo-dGTP pyrophosphatase MutT (NUDIX family)
LIVVRFDRVEARLAGAAAQAAMAPRPRRSWTPGQVPKEARPAAALALVYPRDGRAMLLLTVRGDNLATHGGQVALPGGAVEPGETYESAALREAEEEVGLERSKAAPRLRLTSLHIPVSGYVLHPVVATAAEAPRVLPCEREVRRIVEVGLEDLGSGDLLRRERVERDGLTIDVPYFAVDGEKLWGATAMVVSELLAVVGMPVDPWAPRP